VNEQPEVVREEHELEAGSALRREPERASDDAPRADDDHRPRQSASTAGNSPITGPSPASEAAGEVPWLRPSELPMAVAAPVLGALTDRALRGQVAATRAVAHTPAAVTRLAVRRGRDRRARRQDRGLGR